MLEKLESLSFLDGLLWFAFNNTSFSFGEKGLPPKIHYTLGLNEETQIANLHLTREIPMADGQRKPKVTIFKFRKAMLSEIDMRDFTLNLLNTFTKPINIHKLRKQAGGTLWFISTDMLQKVDGYDDVQEAMFNILKENIHIKKKKRVKIKSQNLEENLRRAVVSSGFKQMIIDNAQLFSWKVQGRENTGTIMGKNDIAIQGLKIFGEWREFRTDLNLNDLWSLILSPELVLQIKSRIKLALESLVQASSYDDTMELEEETIHIEWLGLINEIPREV